MNLRCDTTVKLQVYRHKDLSTRIRSWESFVARITPISLSFHPEWLNVLARGLRQTPYCIEAVAEGGTTVGLLPLMDVRSVLFGRFLTGLPYINYGGVMAGDPDIARQLIDRAVGLADELDVRFLELRHEHPCEHPRLVTRSGSKVHMRRTLPSTPGKLWDELPSKVRNQVRKGTKSELRVVWGGDEPDRRVLRRIQPEHA